MNSTPFDPACFQSLRRGAWGSPLLWLPKTASTQDALEAWGSAEGALCGAEEQTQGRGRLGRLWSAEAGQSLLFSLLLKPLWPSPELSLVLGLATAEALRTLGVEAQVKWPNDVWVQGRKVAGLLLEQRGQFCLAGCGMNVSQSRWPPELEGRAVSLAQAGWQGSREALLAALLAAWEAGVGRWRAQGLAPTLQAWPALDALRGQRVLLQAPQGPVEGEYLGLDQAGRLLIKRPGQSPLAYHSGDVEKIQAQGS